ncbi:uncharacterized protein AMSG_04998 [Thecamonas trahens ATCC 50062]|uniref:RING-type domain-containing protein n=1 Tax=Thecamonas trahens ATCC 50062 TaxID=461836 RepID=A0A0L0D9M2_THETB|nr:hypothetical protein AMSG_04998 [Thecamonas trahens ATCC 50062]KNC49039.1 hypothetical protein AMSG_04998 [Thecamonas trahens ATCC 50062]|eukprot:XP_013758075.1 hypothetical protein AMSG_04998 [Thecamonas trahens ATCC 50062]
MRSPSVPGVRKRLVSPWVAAFVAIAAGGLITAIALVVIILYAYSRTHPIVILGLALLIGLTVATTIGVSLGTRSVAITYPLAPKSIRPTPRAPPPPPAPGPQAPPPPPPPPRPLPVPCKASPPCAPYYCAMGTGFCFDYCAENDHCISGYKCEGDACVPESHGTTGLEEPSVRPLVAIVLGCVVALTISSCMFCILYTLSRRRHGGYVPRSRSRGFRLIAGSICMLLAVVVSGALLAMTVPVEPPLAFDPTNTTAVHDGSGNGTLAAARPPLCEVLRADVCAPYVCDLRVSGCFTTCDVDDQCVAGTTCSGGACVSNTEPGKLSARRYPAWLAASIAVSAGVVFGLAVLAAGCGLWPVSLRRPLHELRANADVRPGFNATCSYLRDPACSRLGYLCDVRVAACFPSCESSLECAPEHGCERGACVRITSQQAVKPLLGSAVTVLAVVALVVVVVVATAWLGLGANCAHRIMYGIPLEKSAALVVVGLAAGLLGLVVIGLPVSYARSKVELPQSLPRSPHAVCGPRPDDSRCFPYACDPHAERCLVGCQTNAHCVTGNLEQPHRCARDGRCVAVSGSTAIGTPQDAWGVGVGATVLTALVLVLVLLPRCRRLYLGYRAQREEQVRTARQEALSEEMAKFADVPPAMLDVVPGGRRASEEGSEDNEEGEADTANDVPLQVLESMSRSSASDESASASTTSDHNLQVCVAAEAGGVGRLSAGTTSSSLLSRDEASVAPAPECVVCMFEAGQVQLVGPGVCEHLLCTECAVGTLKAVLDAGQFPAVCPGCLAESGASMRPRELPLAQRVTADAVEALVVAGAVDEDFARRFIINMVLAALPSTETISCPGCSLLSLRPGREQPEVAAKLASSSAAMRARATAAECWHCKAEFCGECGILWAGHRGVSCTEAANGRGGRMEDVASRDLVVATSKPCPNCGAPVAHAAFHACHHITCACGYGFCIVCLERHPCPREGHGLFCTSGCDCVVCYECRPGAPCPACPGPPNCPACDPRGPNAARLPEGHPSLRIVEEQEAAAAAAAEETGVTADGAAPPPPQGDANDPVRLSFAQMLLTLRELVQNLQRPDALAGGGTGDEETGDGNAGEPNEAGPSIPPNNGVTRTDEEQLALDQFQAVTGAPRISALRLLRIHGWDVTEAVDGWFESGRG